MNANWTSTLKNRRKKQRRNRRLLLCAVLLLLAVSIKALLPETPVQEAAPATQTVITDTETPSFPPAQQAPPPRQITFYPRYHQGGQSQCHF